MGVKTRQLQKERETVDTQLTELADAHCHLDLFDVMEPITHSISQGVKTIITNGVDTRSNMRALELADGRNIFAALGVDPEHANMEEDELEFNIKTIRANAARIVAIGEIGLDFKKAASKSMIAVQRTVFGKFLDLANELKLPVSVHSRNALDEVLEMLSEKGNERVHMHFFEGNAQQAREAERKGYMISVPPLDSSKRARVIREIAIDNIMTESDSPVVIGAPVGVKKSVEIIAAAKGLAFERAAEATVANTKKFFGIYAKAGLMRS